MGLVCKRPLISFCLLILYLLIISSIAIMSRSVERDTAFWSHLTSFCHHHHAIVVMHHHRSISSHIIHACFENIVVCFCLFVVVLSSTIHFAVPNILIHHFKFPCGVFDIAPACALRRQKVYFISVIIIDCTSTLPPSKVCSKTRLINIHHWSLRMISVQHSN